MSARPSSAAARISKGLAEATLDSHVRACSGCEDCRVTSGRARAGVLIVIGLLTAFTTSAVGAETPRDLQRAIKATIHAGNIRTEVHAPIGDIVEEFIAPNRYQGTLRVSGRPPEITIVVGQWDYVQDVGAKPPADQLFVACPTKTGRVPAILPILGYLATTASSKKVAGSDGHYRFTVTRSGKLPAVVRRILSRAKGQLVVTDGHVSAVTISRPQAIAGKWEITFGTVKSISAPAANQVSRRDCKRTPQSLEVPSTTPT